MTKAQVDWYKQYIANNIADKRCYPPEYRNTDPRVLLFKELWIKRYKLNLRKRKGVLWVMLS